MCLRTKKQTKILAVVIPLMHTTFGDLLERSKPEVPEFIPRELRKHLISGFDEDHTKRSSWTDVIVALRKYIHFNLGIYMV